MDSLVRHSYIKALIVGFTIALGLLGRAVPASAANSCRWTGAGGTRTWSTAANWTGCGGVPPQNGDFLVFPNGALTPQNQNDIVGLSVIGVLLSGRSNTTAWQIIGSPITLNGPFTTDSPSDPGGQEGPAFGMPIKIGSANAMFQNLGGGVPNHGTMLLGEIDLNGFLVTFDDNFPIFAGGGISGPRAGGIRVTGTLPSASILMNQNNTYLGTTSIAGGLVIANTALPFGAPEGGEVHIADGVELRLTWTDDFRKDVRFDGNARLTVSPFRDPTISGAMLVAGNNLGIDVAAGQTLTLRGLISTADMGGGPNVTKTGAGTLVFAKPTIANDRWRQLAVTAGVVQTAASEVIPNNAFLTVIAGVFDLHGFSETVGTLVGDGGTIQLGSGTLTVNQNVNVNIATTITGTGNVVKNGGSQLGFTVPNTYTGTTTVTAGILALLGPIGKTINGPLIVNGGTVSYALSDQIADGAPVTINAPGILLASNAIDAIGSLAGSGTVTLAGAQLIAGGNNASTKFTGTIGGAGSVLRKLGTGTMTLSGANTLDTALSFGGSLIVDGTLGGAATAVVANSILGGVGNVGAIRLGPVESLIAAPGAGAQFGVRATTLAAPSAVTSAVASAAAVTDTGIISPGDGPGLPGILHATTLSMNGQVFAVDLNGPAAGANYDQLDLTGNATLAGAATLIVNLGFQPRQGAAFIIVNLAAGKTVTGTFTGLPEGKLFSIGDRQFRISYRGGDGNDITLTAEDDAPKLTYFLAEGATGTFFDEDVLIANPNDAPAPITLTFLKENGQPVVTTRTLPAKSHTTVHVDQLPGLEGAAVSTQVTSEPGAPLVVERSMFWDKSYYAGHTGSAIERPAQDWFFGEGAQGFFSTFLLVINPSPDPATVTFTFLRENESPVIKTLPVGGASRLTVDASTFSELDTRAFGITVHATQPVMVERSMYFGTTPGRLWSGGHESAGVTSASPHWFLAEGATGGFFDTFILLSNPGATPANVTMKYLLDAGDAITVEKTVPANSRLTVNIEAEDDPRLHNAAVSTVVTSDVPIIAERSMYWPTAVRPWGEGHNSFGVIDPGTRWGLAEGRIGGPRKFNTFILLANPQSTAANVTVTFLRDTGQPLVKTFTVPATSRFSIDASSMPELRDEAFGTVIDVTNNVPIVVERSLYWDSGGVVWSGGTNATGIRLP